MESLLKSNRDTNILLDIVIAEIIWVLSSYYDLRKELVIERIRALIQVKSVECHRALLEQTLMVWEKDNISFIDAYLAASSLQQHITIYSYDTKFDHITGVLRKEP